MNLLMLLDVKGITIILSTFNSIIISTHILETILMVVALFQSAKFVNNRRKKICDSQAAWPISNEHVMVKKSSNLHLEFVAVG